MTIADDNQVIYCACGCKEIVPRKKYPSQQNKYISGHQHRGKNNGNYRGGKDVCACPVCGSSFSKWPSQAQTTCGKGACYIEWQRMTTKARGVNKIATTCAHCGRTIYRFPSQIKSRNYCNRHCLAADNPKLAHLNGNWHGGKWKYIKEQVMLRDNYRCAICGFNVHVHVHHIVPLARGGTNAFDNLITLCPNHHAMADLGIINVDHLRNFDWNPDITADPSPHANH